MNFYIFNLKKITEKVTDKYTNFTLIFKVFLFQFVSHRFLEPKTFQKMEKNGKKFRKKIGKKFMSIGQKIGTKK
jgi:hypothetical protein